MKLLNQLKQRDTVYVHTGKSHAIKCTVTSAYYDENNNLTIQVTDGVYNIKFIVDKRDEKSNTTKIKYITLATEINNKSIISYDEDVLEFLSKYSKIDAKCFEELNVGDNIYELACQKDVYTFKSYNIIKILLDDDKDVVFQVGSMVKNGAILVCPKHVNIHRILKDKYSEDNVIYTTDKRVLSTYQHYITMLQYIREEHHNRLCNALKHDMMHKNYEKYFEYEIKD